MISRTSEYALRAMIYLTRHADDCPIPGRKIADEAEIPRKYLSTILGSLVREGMLDSSPGAGGGFRLVRSPKDIMLSEVLLPFEPALTRRRPCPFGSAECGDDQRCAGHALWNQVREAYSRFLENTSLFDVTFERPQRPASSSPKRKKR